MKPRLYQGPLFDQPAPNRRLTDETIPRSTWGALLALLLAGGIILGPCDTASAEDGPTWHPPASTGDKPPTQLGPCSLVSQLCSFDPETGTIPVNQVLYSCTLGTYTWEITVEFQEPCDG